MSYGDLYYNRNDRSKGEIAYGTLLGAGFGALSGVAARAYLGHAVTYFPAVKFMALHGALAGCLAYIVALALEKFKIISLNKLHEGKTLAAYCVALIPTVAIHALALPLTLKTAGAIVGAHVLVTATSASAIYFTFLISYLCCCYRG